INLAAVEAARALGVPAIRGDLLTALRGPFDLVAFNAPYLPSAEDERLPGDIDRAFHGGEGGVEVSARFVADLPRVLAPEGRALLVVSSRADLGALAEAVARAGLRREKVASARFFFEEIAVWRLVSGVRLRPVRDEDLAVFYAQQLDAEATRIAAFPARDRATSDEHWRRVLTDPRVVARAVLDGGEVAG